MTFAVAQGAKSITVIAGEEYHSVDSSHGNYARIKELLKKTPRTAAIEKQILEMMDVKKTIINLAEGRISVKDNQVYFQRKSVSGYMVDRLLELAHRGEDVKPWMRFMDNLMDNPADGVREDLYKWMEVGDLPITEDGCLMGFKKIRGDYTDVHTGRFDNSPGSVLSMPRESCDPRRDRTCSTGFHFCSAGYLSSFGGSKVVTVKINPRDVTAIPSDYNNQKARCCQYVVIGELKNQGAASHPIWKQKRVVDLEDPAELPDVMLPRELKRDKGKTKKGAPAQVNKGDKPSAIKPDPKRTKGPPPKDDLAGKATKQGSGKGGAAPEETKPSKEKAVAKKTTTKKAAAAKPAAKKAAAPKAAATKAPAKKPATKAASRKSPATGTKILEPAVKLPASRKKAIKEAVEKVVAARKPAAKKAAAPKAAATKAPAKKPAAKKAPAKKGGIVEAVKSAVESVVEAVTPAKAPAKKRPSRAKK